MFALGLFRTNRPFYANLYIYFMANETNEPLETSTVGEAEEKEQVTGYRDVIAERLAQRSANRPPQKQYDSNESNEDSVSSNVSDENTAGETQTATGVKLQLKSEQSEKTIVESLAAEAEREEELSEGLANIPLPPQPTQEVSLKLKSMTESLETEAPEQSEKSSDEKQRPGRERQSQRERQREKQIKRRAEQDAAAAQGRSPLGEKAPIHSDRTDGVRAPREIRQTQSQSDRRQPPALQSRPQIQTSSIPKTDFNTVQRAKSLAMRLGVSVVIPLYNEQDSLRELTAAIKEELFKLCEKKFEIIYVNDGSTDRSGDILRDIVAGTSRVTTLTFRSNMGKSPALAAGFNEAKHGIVITMDADLQDDPKELVNLIAKLEEGYDLVTGWKKKRNDPITKTVPSKFFNTVTSFFSGIKLHDFNCGLKAYRKEVIDSLDVYGELHRYLPALAHWKGFRIAEIPVTHHPRRFGKSKFGGSRFFKGFLDLLSIVFTNRYGKRPLHLFGTVGTLLALVGAGINGYVTYEWFNGIALSNRPILLLGILLILVGVQLVSLGLLGEMIVKNAPNKNDVGFVRNKRAPRTDDERRRPNTGRPSMREGGRREGNAA